MQNKIEIRTLSKKELTDFFVEKGEKKFRAKQVWEWIWKKTVTNFDRMNNLSLKTRKLLEEHFNFDTIKPIDSQKSSDGTIKTAYQLHDGYVIETVLIPSRKRTTVCVSSQVGCNLGCKFCATGKLKMKRNLTAAEMFDQVARVNDQSLEIYERKLTNIVYMGMGEPLLNYENVMSSIERITSEDGLAMSPYRITLSTSGITKNIKRLADDQIRFELAISLHTAINNNRSEIMPINKTEDLGKLSEAITYFHKKTGKRITYEYLMMKGVNDSLADAKKLARFCKIAPCKINLIEYNATDSEFKSSDPEVIEKFAKHLEGYNLIVNVRRSKGKDIDAACGQLANKEAK